MRSLQSQSRTARLLRAIADGLDETLMLGYHPGRVMRYGYAGARAIREAKFRKANREALARLRRAKLIKERRDADRIVYALTKEGEKELLRLRVLDADLFEDGRFCIVAYDIPERYRRARHALRVLLKETGFVQIQRSVWISPVNAALPLAAFVEKIHAKRWVRIFVADEITASQDGRSAKM